MMYVFSITFSNLAFFCHDGASGVTGSATLFLLWSRVVAIVLFSIIASIGHAFEVFRLVLRFRPEGETDHLIEVGLPPGFPAFLFLRTAAAFCPFDILAAVAAGRHAGYFLLDLLADLRPHFFPVATSRQSSLNHLRSPP